MQGTHDSLYFLASPNPSLYPLFINPYILLDVVITLLLDEFEDTPDFQSIVGFHHSSFAQFLIYRFNQTDWNCSYQTSSRDCLPK